MSQKKVIHQEGDHEVCAVEATQLSNGELAIRFRCCEDPSTDHFHTLKPSVTDVAGNLRALTNVEIDTKLKAVAATFVVPQHEAMKTTKKYIADNLLSVVPADESTHVPTMEKLE